MMQLLEVVIQNFEQKLKTDEDHIAVLEYQKSKQEEAKTEATQRLKARLADSKSAQSPFLPHEDIQLYDTYSRLKKVAAVLMHPEWQPSDPQATHLLLIKRAKPELRFNSIEKSALKQLSEDIRRINFAGTLTGNKRVLPPLQAIEEEKNDDQGRPIANLNTNGNEKRKLCEFTYKILQKIFS